MEARVFLHKHKNYLSLLLKKTAGLCYAVSVSQILLNFCCIWKGVCWPWEHIITRSSSLYIWSQRRLYRSMWPWRNILTAINKSDRLSLYERRRQLIAVLYERQNDTLGNLAFEFSVSSHTIRNDIRVLELEYPIDTRMGAGGGVFILDSSRLQQRWLTVRQRELLMDVCGALNNEQALLMKSIIGGLSPWIMNAV